MANPGFKKALLCAVTVFFWLAQYIYVPFLTPYLMALAFSATVVGGIVGAYGLTQLLLRIPLGITVDIIQNHKLVILMGTVCAGLSSIGMLLFPSPLMLFLANAMSGVASSAWVSFTILYPAYYEDNQSAKAIGIINAFQNIGILSAFILGGLLFEHFGIRSLFITSFISGILGSLLALCIKRETSDRRVNVRLGSLVKVMKERRVIFYSLLCSVVYLILFATVFSFSTSTAKQMGASGPQLGIFAMLYSVGCILGSYFIGTRTARALGESRLVSLAFILMAIYCASIPMIVRLAWFFPLHLVCGFGSGILTSCLMAFAVKEVGPERKTTAMGFYQSIYCVGMTIGPVIMGLLIEHSTKAVAFLSVAAVALASAIMVPLVHRSGFLEGRRSACVAEIEATY